MGHGSTFDGGDDFVIPARAKNASGAVGSRALVPAKAQQTQYPGLGDLAGAERHPDPGVPCQVPVRSVPIQTLAYGSVEYTLAYDQVFNEPGSPWLKMFDEAVYSNNVPQCLKIGQSGIQSTLNSVTS